MTLICDHLIIEQRVQRSDSKLHNTSVKMIERHYAKYIATALEDLARAAVVSLVPRSDGNVVPMGKRA